MGNDSVVECVNENGVVKAHTSFTKAIPNNYGARRSDIVSRIVNFLQLVDFPFFLRTKILFDSKNRGLKMEPFTVALNVTRYLLLMRLHSI
jgi:hypothetical protein